MNNTLKYSSMFIILAMATFIGCTTASDVAEKVSGQWSGTTQRFEKKTMIDGSFTPVFRFDRAEGQNAGAVQLTSMVSVTMLVDAPVDSTGTSTVSATASGMATVSGTWRIDDVDEIKLSFDMSTLVIDVDPDVNFELASVWTSYDTPEERIVPAAVYKAFEAQMREGMTASLRALDEIDHIKYKDGMMTCEYLGSAQTLNRIFE